MPAEAPAARRPCRKKVAGARPWEGAGPSIGGGEIGLEAEGVEPSSRGRLILASTCVVCILMSDEKAFAN